MSAEFTRPGWQRGTPMADYSLEQRSAFAARFRAAVADSPMTQTEIAVALGLSENSRSQVSQWASSGINPPRPPAVFELEALLDLPAGELSQHLGYLPAGHDIPECATETAIAADRRLPGWAKKTLLVQVREFINQVDG
jgi:transcriptional regulator with XRE-family HTH domain